MPSLYGQGLYGTGPYGRTVAWGLDARHEFSTHQAWNATGELLLLQNEQGGSAPTRVFCDGNTYQPLFTTPSNYPSTGTYEERWHPHQGRRNIMIMAGGASLVHFDVRANAVVKSWTLPISVLYIGNLHGNPTDDGRYLLLHNFAQMFIVDMEADIIGPLVNVPLSDSVGNAYTFSYATISPSGRFATVHYDSQNGFPANNDRVFDVNLTTLAITLRTTLDPSRPGISTPSIDGFIYPIGNSDLACNPWSANDDCVVGIDGTDNVGRFVPGVITSTGTNGHLIMARLRDGQVTSLSDPVNEARVLNVSCRNVSRPGWCYVTYIWPWPLLNQRFAAEVVAVKLDTTQTIERLAHHHTDAVLDLLTDPYETPTFDFVYRSNAHALPSQDGYRVIVASNWLADGSGGGGNIQSHVVDTKRRNVSLVSNAFLAIM